MCVSVYVVRCVMSPPQGYLLRGSQSERSPWPNTAQLSLRDQIRPEEHLEGENPAHYWSLWEPAALPSGRFSPKLIIVSFSFPLHFGLSQSRPIGQQWVECPEIVVIQDAVLC